MWKESMNVVYWKCIIESKDICYMQIDRKNMVRNLYNSLRLGGGERIGA